MANRGFVNDGFWDRVDEAIQDSGLTKIQIAEKMGVERKYFYSSGSSSSKHTRSWHSGSIADFCRITKVSADWLLGLSRTKYTKLPQDKPIAFKVIDVKTGKPPIFDGRHIFREKWFKNSKLYKFDISGWAIDEDGNLMLVDDCDNIVYPPQDRFKVVFL